MQMIQRFSFILCVFISTQVYTQNIDSLSAIERAYLFHSVKKTPIFERHIGRYFNYIGENIVFTNGEPNYDSIEKNILSDPNLLDINTHELAKSPRGIIAELSNKLAIWELNKMLHARQTKDSTFQHFTLLFEQFEKILIVTLPQSILQNDKDKIIVPSRIYNILNPNLSLEEKIAQLNAIPNISPNDKLQIIRTLYQSVNIYVEQQTQRIFRMLGANFSTMHNILTRTADGKTSSDAFNDRQKEESIFWNKGLPKASGFFAYDLQLKQANNTHEQPKIEAITYTTTDLETVGNNKLTKLHFDIWGYQPDNQSMVVIEKHGKIYPLFNSGETRFLSPDSTFSGQNTFQQRIDELQNIKIADLTEKIEGKEGFDAQIAYHKEQKNDTELRILKSEKKFSDLGYSTITTSKKVSKKAKKTKKQAVLRGVGADNWDANPTTKSKKKQKGKSQNTIIDLYQQFEWHKLKIKELEKEKQVALDLRAYYQLQLDQYIQLRGHNWMPYTKKDGIYTFADSSTFDFYMQDFNFPATKDKEIFEIRLIAIPDSTLATTAQSIMLHVTLLDAHPNENARINASFIQKMNPKQILSIDKVLFSDNDSIAIRQFFEQVLDKEQKIEIHASGQGIGVWNGTQVVKYQQQLSPSDYSEEFEFAPEEMKNQNLWWTEILFFVNNPNEIIINIFINEWDEIPTVLLNKKTTAFQQKNKLSVEEILTVQRAASILKKINSELNSLAGRYLSIEDTKTVVERLNKIFTTAKIQVENATIAISDL